MRRSILISTVFLLALSQFTSAKTFYCDPVNGNMANDGSSGHPWKTLQEVVGTGKILTNSTNSSSVKAGDTLLLRTGYHGYLSINGIVNSTPIVIAAEAGSTPKLSSIKLTNCGRWKIKGIQVCPDFAPTYQKIDIIAIASTSSGSSYEIVIDSCDIYSISEFTKWTTAAQWDQLASDAINVSGKRCAITNNRIRNVNCGIMASKDSCLVENNIIENFAGDGLRCIANYCVFRYNLVKNVLAVNENHRDGFQSWTVGTGGVGTGTLIGNQLIGNKIFSTTDPKRPFTGDLQGIGCFDGMYVGWVIENNIIAVDQHHGITFSGAKNLRIVNNTVCAPKGALLTTPWIRISNHKNGTLSTGNLVRNNLSTNYSIVSGQTMDYNVTISKPDSFFVNWSGSDLHLKTGCKAIDVGTMLLATTTDIDRIARPQGKTIDAGAYEYVRLYPTSVLFKVSKEADAYNLKAAQGINIPENVTFSLYNVQGRLLYQSHANNVNYQRNFAEMSSSIRKRFGVGNYVMRVSAKGFQQNISLEFNK